MKKFLLVSIVIHVLIFAIIPWEIDLKNPVIKVLLIIPNSQLFPEMYSFIKEVDPDSLKEEELTLLQCMDDPEDD